MIAFIWGLAEGLFFFIIPDVWLSFVPLREKKYFIRSISSTLFTVLGSLSACLILFSLLNIGTNNVYSFFYNFWNSLPGVYPYMFKEASRFLQESGAKGFTLGPSSGIPYRVFLLEAWKANLNLFDVLMWTPIARLERIILAPLVVSILRFIIERFTKRKIHKASFVIVAFYWVGVYVWYWGFFLPQQNMLLK